MQSPNPPPGGAAPSGKMSPFEFLEDLKRDRSSSLETLHHMLRCAAFCLRALSRFFYPDGVAAATSSCARLLWAAPSTRARRLACAWMTPPFLQVLDQSTPDDGSFVGEIKNIRGLGFWVLELSTHGFVWYQEATSAREPAGDSLGV
jgi:hypothetical protein